MKKAFMLVLAFILALTLSACAKNESNKTDNAQKSAISEAKAEQDDEGTEAATKAFDSIQEDEEMKIKVNIGGKAFSATLEDNAAAKEFYELIKSEGITIDMSDYSGFEKVGSLGHTLTSNDKQTTTKAGDIVLYQSNQIVMFYGSNSWSYTRLGKIDDLSGWEEALGSGDITAEFTL